MRAHSATYIATVLSSPLSPPHPTLIVFVSSLVWTTNFVLYTTLFELFHSLSRLQSISTISYELHVVHNTVRTIAFHAPVSISAIYCFFFFRRRVGYNTCHKIHYRHFRINAVVSIANISTTQTGSLAISCSYKLLRYMPLFTLAIITMHIQHNYGTG